MKRKVTVLRSNPLIGWYNIGIGGILLLLLACTPEIAEDSFLEDINRIVSDKRMPQSVPKEEHKRWISLRIDSLAAAYGNLDSIEVDQYRYFFNAKIDFLYEYYTGEDLEVISDNIDYIFQNYKPDYCSPALQARFYNELAHFYASIGLFEEAISFHKKMKHTGADLSFLLYQYKHLGNYYFQHGQYEDAIDAYREKYSEQRKRKDIRNDMLAHMCNNIGLAYSKNKQLDSALHYFDKAKVYWEGFDYEMEEMNYLKGVADGNKAEAYMMVGLYGKAIPLLGHEIKVTQAYPKSVPQYLTKTRLSLARCYLESNRHKEAEEQLNILQYGIDEEGYDHQKQYWQLAKEIEIGQHNTEAALSIDAKLDKINNRIRTEQNKQDEIEKALRLQVSNIQTHVLQKEKENQRFKINTIIGFGVLIFFVLIAGVLYRKRVLALRRQNQHMRREIQHKIPVTELAESKPLFTKREEDILPFIVQNYNNKEIADRLCISVNTVKYHVKNIYNKLEVSSRKEVIDKLEEQ